MRSNLFAVRGCSDCTVDPIKLKARTGAIPLFHGKSYICNIEKGNTGVTRLLTPTFDFQLQHYTIKSA